MWGAGLAVGLAGLLAKRPDIVLNGGALALSQFVLEDGDIPTIMQREFKKNGVELVYCIIDIWYICYLYYEVTDEIIG